MKAWGYNRLKMTVRSASLFRPGLSVAKGSVFFLKASLPENWSSRILPDGQPIGWVTNSTSPFSNSHSPSFWQLTGSSFFFSDSQKPPFSNSPPFS